MIEIEKPTIKTLELSPDGSYGKFVVEPLERGYGITLGNSLRRVLLSSLPGFAIKSVRIQDVLHEFTTVPHVKEDVVELLLNLKNLHAKINSDEVEKTLRIDIDTPGVVTAGDIIAEGDVEIINTDLYICTVEEGGSLKMEFILSRGRGYVPAENNKDEDLPLGWLPVDSIYTPVDKVNFTVEKTRVGKVTDFDKLYLEIWTNGTILPNEAASLGSKILVEHLNLFMEISDMASKIDIMVEKEDDTKRKILDTTIDDLELSPRASNCLKRTNIHTVEALVGKTKSELKKVKNFGEKSLNEIIDKLESLGLELKKED